MKQDLLEIYLSSGDCTDQIRRMLMKEIENMKTVESGIVREYEFNRFNLSMDSEKNEVVIEDDLIMEETDEIIVSLNDFYDSLSKWGVS